MGAFRWARERVTTDGAEFLLDDSLSYRYTLDREEEVAEMKMRNLFSVMEG
jgi:hypothetical protein